MCTVTFIPANDKYYITTGRDEKNTRKPASAPEKYKFRGRELMFPKDADAGGTWVAVHENGNAAVLLNGAFKMHLPEPPYRKSRGKILLDIIGADSPMEHFCRIDLDRIEPFTLVLLERNKLYECRWDGNVRHCHQQLTDRPHIWLSVTLYDEEAVIKRTQWFETFLINKPNLNREDILEFHKYTVDDNTSDRLRLIREDVYSTMSITSLMLTAEQGNMKYLDLKNNSIQETRIEFRQIVRNDML